MVKLDGSASLGVPGASLAYGWSLKSPSGDVVALANANAAKTSFTADTLGAYVATLTVTNLVNGVAYTNPASVNVAVLAANTLTAGGVMSALRAQAASGAALLPPDASAPLVTAGTDSTGGSSIANSRLVAWDDGAFTYSGLVKSAGAVYPDYLFGSNQTVSYAVGTRVGNYLTVDFDTDAAAFEVFQKGLGYNSRLRVVVDGRLAADNETAYPNDGGLYLTKVTFTGKQQRHIRLLMNAPYFGGVRVGASDALTKPTAHAPLRVMFVGDSITEGPAGQDFPTSYAPLVADLLGWQDAWLSGVGSTGYLAAPAPKLTFRQRYATDVKAVAPNVLVIAGGINDTAFTDEQIRQESSALFDQIQADLPATVVFVLGPWGSTDRVRAGINTALKTAVGTRTNFFWVPNVDDHWLTGSGSVANPTGDGNEDIYLSADGTHPTPPGIKYLADKLAASVKALINR